MYTQKILSSFLIIPLIFQHFGERKIKKGVQTGLLFLFLIINHTYRLFAFWRLIQKFPSFFLIINLKLRILIYFLLFLSFSTIFLIISHTYQVFLPLFQVFLLFGILYKTNVLMTISYKVLSKYISS